MARSEARKANRDQAGVNRQHVPISNVSLPITSSGMQFETSIPITETRPVLDEREITRIRELYQTLVELDLELHEHLRVLAGTVPLDILIKEEAWLQGTLHRLKGVKVMGDNGTALVLASMISNTARGLEDVTSRKLVQKSSGENNGTDVYNTGEHFGCSLQCLLLISLQRDNFVSSSSITTPSLSCFCSSSWC